MRTHTVMLDEPCGEGVLAKKCDSRKLYVHDRGHAWCAGCGAKKSSPGEGSNQRGSSEDYSSLDLGDSTGVP